MRISSLYFAVFIVALGYLATAPMAGAQDAHDVSVGANWRADLNKGVSNDNHWRWTLRRVERVGDKLTVALRYRNNASTGRPIFSDAGIPHLRHSSLIMPICLTSW